MGKTIRSRGKDDYFRHRAKRSNWARPGAAVVTGPSMVPCVHCGHRMVMVTQQEPLAHFVTRWVCESCSPIDAEAQPQAPAEPTHASTGAER